MRVSHARVRHLVFGYVAGLRIEPADHAGAVAGKPDVALPVLSEAMRARAWRLEFEFLELRVCRGEPTELVGELPGIPDRAVLRG